MSSSAGGVLSPNPNIEYLISKQYRILKNSKQKAREMDFDDLDI
jgi:hypothetical protein